MIVFTSRLAKKKTLPKGDVVLKTVLKLNRMRYIPTGGQRAIYFLSFLLAMRRVINRGCKETCVSLQP